VGTFLRKSRFDFRSRSGLVERSVRIVLARARQHASQAGGAEDLEHHAAADEKHHCGHQRGAYGVAAGVTAIKHGAKASRGGGDVAEHSDRERDFLTQVSVLLRSVVIHGATRLARWLGVIGTRVCGVGN